MEGMVNAGAGTDDRNLTGLKAAATSTKPLRTAAIPRMSERPFPTAGFISGGLADQRPAEQKDHRHETDQRDQPCTATTAHTHQHGGQVEQKVTF